ncbi:MAG: 50S ribosomal protein L23 [Halobacteriota archaeon]
MSDVIDHPLVTEKAMNLMDFQNKLQFIVNDQAAKPDIAAAIEERFDVVVTDVTTQITMEGTKKATVTLGPDDDAGEIASRIGVF